MINAPHHRGKMMQAAHRFLFLRCDFLFLHSGERLCHGSSRCATSLRPANGWDVWAISNPCWGGDNWRIGTKGSHISILSLVPILLVTSHSCSWDPPLLNSTSLQVNSPCFLIPPHVCRFYPLKIKRGNGKSLVHGGVNGLIIYKILQMVDFQLPRDYRRVNARCLLFTGWDLPCFSLQIHASWVPLINLHIQYIAGW